MFYYQCDFRSCTKDDKYFISYLQLVALKAVHVALSSSLRLIFKFRRRFLDTIKRKRIAI
jgi:hypothetical protein